jgi:predicted RNA-binding protein YlxR (DUF448 family)
MRRDAERTCLGCRRVRAKLSLVRFVRGEDGRARVGAGGVGRGAYACPNVECLKQALSRGRLGHAFRRPTEPPVEAVAVILAAVRARIEG